jgi:hypothetical protein
MSLGESILDHYELFLGKYIGVDKYTSGEYVIQLLGPRQIISHPTQRTPNRLN